jgi:small subunit ribosomal protein S9
MAKKVQTFYGTGRRKNASARVFISPSTEGSYTVNGKDLKTYVGYPSWVDLASAPLVVTDTLDKIEVKATVSGGGVSGQAGALRHGLARALCEYNPNLRPVLKANGFLTRDPRMVERKKPGLKKARRRPQFSKR